MITISKIDALKLPSWAIITWIEETYRVYGIKRNDSDNYYVLYEDGDTREHDLNLKYISSEISIVSNDREKEFVVCLFEERAVGHKFNSDSTTYYGDDDEEEEY